jgi:hypothetical protein
MDEPMPHEEGLSELGFWHRILLAPKGIWHHWVILLSGVGSIFLAVGSAAKDAPLAARTFWVMAGVCGLAAAFRAAYLLYHRSDKKRQDRENELMEAITLKILLHDRTTVDRRNDAVSAIVECFHGDGAQNCGVTWQKSDPPISEYPVPLCCSGSNNLNAGESRLFNPARINPETGEMEVMGADRADVSPIDKVRYRVTLRAHAANTPAYQDKEFILDVNERTRRLHLYPVLDGNPDRNVPQRVIPERFER